MPSREDMNKRFSYITRAERVLGRRASIARRFFGTRRGRGRRRRSLETNSARLKKKKGKWGWPTARARATVSSKLSLYPRDGWILRARDASLPSSSFHSFLPLFLSCAFHSHPRLISCVPARVSLYVSWQVLMARWSWECEIRGAAKGLPASFRTRNL